MITLRAQEGNRKENTANVKIFPDLFIIIPANIDISLDCTSSRK